MTSATPIQMSAEQVDGALALAAGADSVELKLTIPEADGRSAVRGLGLDPLQAQIRQVFFFDTPDLALNKAGLVVRARRVQQRGDDSVVKLRPVVPADLPKKLRKSPNLVVEVDAMPGGYVCSASCKGERKATAVRKVAIGKGSNSSLFSKEQRAFFEAHRPDGIELDQLEMLGPILVLKLKFAPKGYSGKLVAELWTYPDGSRILELSTKCAPADTMKTAARTRAFLESKGVNLSGEQQTKTKTALEYFSNILRASPEAAKSGGS